MYVEQQSSPSSGVRQLHAAHANPFSMAQICATWGRGSYYWEHLRFSLTAQSGFVTALVQSLLKPADETSPAAASIEFSSAFSPLLQRWGVLRPAQCTHQNYVLAMCSTSAQGLRLGAFSPLREAVVQRREVEPGLSHSWILARLRQGKLTQRPELGERRCWEGLVEAIQMWWCPQHCHAHTSPSTPSHRASECVLAQVWASRWAQWMYLASLNNFTYCGFKKWFFVKHLMFRNTLLRGFHLYLQVRLISTQQLLAISPRHTFLCDMIQNFLLHLLWEDEAF